MEFRQKRTAPRRSSADRPFHRGSDMEHTPSMTGGAVGVFGSKSSFTKQPGTEEKEVESVGHTRVTRACPSTLRHFLLDSDGAKYCSEQSVWSHCTSILHQIIVEDCLWLWLIPLTALQYIIYFRFCRCPFAGAAPGTKSDVLFDVSLISL